ncbi:MAG: hypothetical protein M1839_000493 [Geoglossum umbratile]|nr:MAG: hypothetical protein M1839_000493 [Geoglossum umbratile]
MPQEISESEAYFTYTTLTMIWRYEVLRPASPRLRYLGRGLTSSRYRDNWALPLAKEPHEHSLPFLLDLVNVFVHRIYDWEPTEKKDHNAKKDKAMDGDDSVVQKHGPWADSSKPYEDRKVKEHVYRGL